MTERVPLNKLGKQETTPVAVDVGVPADMPVMYEGLSVDLARHFGEDVFSIDPQTKKKMQDIYTWVAKDLLEVTTGNVLERVGNIERMLGMGINKDKIIERVWNWLRISTHMQELRKRQRAMEL